MTRFRLNTSLSKSSWGLAIVPRNFALEVVAARDGDAGIEDWEIEDLTIDCRLTD
jgi:hypothetical protein